MPVFKRLAALTACLVLCAALFTGCGGQEAGLSLPVSVGGQVDTLDPIYAEDVSSQTALVHLYENLMKVVSDGNGGTTVANGMAKTVETESNYDGTVTYTFRLRTAKWSDGKAVTAEDFVYAWQRLADPSCSSPYAELLSVVCGYREARAARDMSLLEVSAKNDSTLVVKLNGQYDWFLREVCTSPATMPLRKDVLQALKEAGIQAGEALPWWNDPTALVTNGPYVVADYQSEAYLQLTASESYSSNQQGPRTLTLRFADSAEEAETLYQEKEADIIWPLTEETLEELAQDEDWSPIPELSSCAVIYNVQNEALVDPLIRQAMAQVIDRSALAEAAGVCASAAEGLVPYGVTGSEEGDFRTIGGALLDNDPENYEASCIQAEALLSDAGYDSGKELGSMELLYEEDGSNADVAETLCEQWRSTLGVEVTPVGVTEQELWIALHSGEYTLAIADLEASGNDAECFLMNWTSDSQNNVAGYANSAYDTLMSIIATAADGVARMGCLHDAEALLLEDCALSPLYTKGTDWMLRDTLTGALRDARGWYVFSYVSAV